MQWLTDPQGPILRTIVLSDQLVVNTKIKGFLFFNYELNPLASSGSFPVFVHMSCF